MIKAIATDLDGTLLYPKKRRRLITGKKIKKLQEFYQNGGEIVLVSGRGPLFCRLVSEKISIPCNIIACSGAYVEVKNKVIKENFIPNNIVQKINELLITKRNRSGIIITTDDYLLLSKLNALRLHERLMVRLYRMGNGKYNENIIVSEEKFERFISMPDRGVLKVVIFIPDYLDGDRYAFAELLKSEIGDKLAINVTKSGLEITPAGIDKGNAVEALAEYLKIDKDEIVVVGDDGNDIPMFRKFKHSFIMANGYEGAKNEAEYTIDEFDQLFAFIDDLNKKSHSK